MSSTPPLCSFTRASHVLHPTPSNTKCIHAHSIPNVNWLSLPQKRHLNLEDSQHITAPYGSRTFTMPKAQTSEVSSASKHSKPARASFHENYKSCCKELVQRSLTWRAAKEQFAEQRRRKQQARYNELHRPLTEAKRIERMGNLTNNMDWLMARETEKNYDRMKRNWRAEHPVPRSWN